jgi:hypothetical protein
MLLISLPGILVARIDDAATGKAGKGDHSERRMGPAIHSPHIVTPDATGHSGTALEGCSG